MESRTALTPPAATPPLAGAYPRAWGTSLFKAALAVSNSLGRSAELLAVIRGEKPLARQDYAPRELPALKRFCDKHRLLLATSAFGVLDLDRELRVSNAGARVPANSPGARRFAYISPDPAALLKAAAIDDAGDDLALGLLLGYPRCCAAFFARRGQPGAGAEKDLFARALRRSGAGPFSRLLNPCDTGTGLKLVDHFTCSFRCAPSLNMARTRLKLLREQNPRLAGVLYTRLAGTYGMSGKPAAFR